MWVYKSVFFKAGIIPLLLLLVLELTSQIPFHEYFAGALGIQSTFGKFLAALGTSILRGLIYVLIFTSFAVMWHRLYLIKSEQQTILRTIKWKKHHIDFAIIFGLLSLLWWVLLEPVNVAIATSLPDYIMDILVHSGHNTTGFELIMGTIVAAILLKGGAEAIIILISSRWVLMLPASAVGNRITFKRSWKASSGNWVRIWAVVLLSVTPLELFVTIAFKALPVWLPIPELGILVYAFAYLLIIALGVSALSASYQNVFLEDANS